MKKIILVIFICLFGQLFNCSILFSQEEEIELGEIVVTATKTEKEIKDIPASVSVIKEDEIKNTSSYDNLNDIVKQTPSVDARNLGGIATTVPTTVSIRGMSLRDTLLMVDGQVLNDSLNNFAIFNLIPKENIERIEIVRGPFSALYGTNAGGGVINVITKDKFTKKLSGKVEFGNFSYRNYVVIKEDKFKDLGYSLSIERRETNNYFADNSQKNRDYEENKIWFKISKSIDEKSKINFSFNYFRSKGGYGLTEFISPQKEKDIKKEVFLANLTYKSIFKNLKYKIGLSTNNPETKSIGESIDPKKIPPFPPKYVQSINTYSSNDTNLNFEGNINLNEKNNLIFGSDLSFLNGKWEIKNYDTGALLSDKLDKKVENYAFYLQDEIKPDEKFLIIGGFRFDKHQQFGSEFSPKLSFNFKLNENTNIYTSYGKAFRAPSLGELYSPPWMRVPGKLYIGNPDLKPEISQSFELGMKGKIKEFETRISLYQNKVKDLIQLQLEGNNEINRNIGKAKTEGFELEEIFKANKNINISFNYSYLEAKDEKTGERLEYSPYNKLNLGVLGKIKNLNFNTYFNFVDERLYVDRKTGKKFELESYIVADLNLVYELDKLTNINLTVKNLFDKTYQEYGGYNAPKRQISLGIKRSF
jgi:outer membrane receptor for ferrienterochelin and colicins